MNNLQKTYLYYQEKNVCICKQYNVILIRIVVAENISQYFYVHVGL